MQFLIDADLPRDTAALLASYGHIAVDVRDIGMRSSEDREIASHARQNGMCILTADWGFSDIRIFPPKNHAGIVIIGLPAHATGSQLLDVLRVLLERPDLIALLPGRLAVVEKNRVRLRPRP
jgi:predicted nuclease of predicted toxin-antitoxin system